LPIASLPVANAAQRITRAQRAMVVLRRALEVLLVAAARLLPG